MAERPVTRPVLTDRDSAERLAGEVEGAIAKLEGALEAETALLAEGRIRDGLARADEKKEATGDYLRRLEAAKANAVAMARLAPDLLPGLRAAQERLQAAAQRNQAVVATARAVSDGLIQGLADELAERSRPRGYEPPKRGPVAKRSADPLAFSRRY